MIRGIFFDLGGTLFSYKNVNRTTLPILEHAIEKSGKIPDREKIKAAYRESSESVALEYSSKEYYLHRDFFNDVFLLFLEKLEVKRDSNLLSWYASHHREKIIKCLELKKDCLTTLSYLKSRNLYISIVSNIDEDMLNPLLEIGNLGELVDHAISSEKANSCKPDRSIFEYALKMSKLEAQSIIFVGDSPEHDIAGAIPLGFKTVLITDGGLEPPLQTGRGVPGADHTVGSLTELIPLIE